MTILHRVVRCVISVALALLSVATGFAQSSMPQQSKAIKIEGKVQNTRGEAVAGASVLLEEKAQASSEQTKTTVEGKFTFVIQHPGTYTVTAEKAGIRSRATDAMELSAGETKSIQVVLDISAPSGAPGEMEFEDKPNFTVAGVTDWSGAGGHGSDTSLRTSESLARDTLALKSGGKDAASVSAAGKAADAHRAQGELDERAGDALGAVREFELAAGLDPSEQNYFEWGTELLLHRAVSPAVIVFRKGSLLHPHSSRMLVGLGAGLYAGGSYELAATELCHASDLDPQSATPYLFLGKMEVTAAIALPCGEEKLARFLQQQPGNALANYYYGMVLLKRERDTKNSSDSQKAEALFEKAVAIDPRLGEAYLQLGILYAEQGANDRAIAAYKKAIEASPGLSQAHYRLSQLYKRVGEKVRADQEMQIYKQVEKTEAEEVERQRREVQQFLIILQ